MKKPSVCDGCPLNHVTNEFVQITLPSTNNPRPDLFIGEVSSMEDVKEGRALSGGAGAWFNSMLKASKINRANCAVWNVLPCCPPEGVSPVEKEWCYTDRATARAGVEYCVKHHLFPTIQRGKWGRIIAMGDLPLSVLTPRSGLSVWRGSPLPLKGEVEKGPRVLPTYHPTYLMRDARQFDTTVRDLRKPLTLPPEQYNLYPSLEEVKGWKGKEFSFDFEWDRAGNITLCGLSDQYYTAMVVPFVGDYIPLLKRIFEESQVLIGHNIVGADTRHFEKLGWDVRATLIDTMLMHHLVQPDARHGLAYVASVFTNKVHWKGSGEEQEDDNGNFTGSGAQYKTWNSPEAIPTQYGGYGGCRDGEEAFRLYNARDTDAAFQCVAPLQNSLKRYGLDNIYTNVSVPTAFLCRDMADEGMKVDNARVVAIREEVENEIATLEEQLPFGLAPYEEPTTIQIAAPAGTYRPKTKKCKGKKKSGTLHDPTAIVFDRPGTLACPVCKALIESGPMSECKVVRVPSTKRIVPWNSADKVAEYARNLGMDLSRKTKSGKVASDKKSRKIWGRTNVEFSTVDHLKVLNTRRNSFAKPGLKYVERVYFNLLPHGTAEGRLSSSGRRRGELVYDPNGMPIREDGEFVTITDPNIQNQPKLIRKLFLPDHPDWSMVNLDIVQGENRLTAWLAKDFERLERLNTKGYDEHADLAARCFQRPLSDVGKGGPFEFLRQIGKKINHARNYGMGARKMQMELELEGYRYSLRDVEEMIEEWKKMNRGTANWQDRTIAIAKQQGFLENVFGRKRWFSSRDFGTKALAFLPASTLADCVLRMMIGMHSDRFHEACYRLGLTRTCVIPKPWRMFNQVHDSVGLMGPDGEWKEVAYMVKSVMEQPWPQLDGYSLEVDCEYAGPGKSWGDVKGVKL